MEPIISASEIRKINLTTRITLILFGVFIASSIFAITIKMFEEIGIWMGLVICLAFSFYGFYYKRSGSRTRIIAWSILATIIVIGIIYFAGLNYIYQSLKGLAS